METGADLVSAYGHFEQVEGIVWVRGGGRLSGSGYWGKGKQWGPGVMGSWRSFQFGSGAGKGLGPTGTERLQVCWGWFSLGCVE